MGKSFFTRVLLGLRTLDPGFEPRANRACDSLTRDRRLLRRDRSVGKRLSRHRRWTRDEVSRRGASKGKGLDEKDGSGRLDGRAETGKSPAAGYRERRSAPLVQVQESRAMSRLRRLMRPFVAGKVRMHHGHGPARDPLDRRKIRLGAGMRKARLSSSSHPTSTPGSGPRARAASPESHPRPPTRDEPRPYDLVGLETSGRALVLRPGHGAPPLAGNPLLPTRLAARRTSRLVRRGGIF